MASIGDGWADGAWDVNSWASGAWASSSSPAPVDTGPHTGIHKSLSLFRGFMSIVLLLLAA